jgi:hypothetical protein
MKGSKATRFSVCILAAVAVASAFAAPLDAKITIDRAVGSSTVTVQYSGASATLVEMRLNGTSLGTRTLSGDKESGESNFTLNPAELRDGENKLEIRLYDRTGKLVGQKTEIVLAEQSSGSAVYMNRPKVGETVMGIADVQIGFNASLKNVYVSYFVDGQFKGMTNYAPYTFAWDTAKESNGWHEIEAWAIDEASNTYKTRKVRLFVNNPGGRTDRTGDTSAEPIKNGVKGVGLAGSIGSIKSVQPGAAIAAKPSSVGVTPRMDRIILNTASAKPVPTIKTTAAGPKLMTPTGKRVVTMPVPVTVPVSKPATIATTKTTSKPVATKVSNPPVVRATKSVVKLGEMKVASAVKASNSVNAAIGAMRTVATLAISKGTRLPNVGAFSVLYNSKFVNFDVSPRVDNGVPMTPFRHLFEAAGGEVKWENMTKSVMAKADGTHVLILIGDTNAKVNDLSIKLESIPYLERGRTIVPVSFLRDALKVEIEYDKTTNHVLITPKKD